MADLERTENNQPAKEETFVRIQIPQQKLYDGVQFPSLVSPLSSASSSSLSHLTHSIQLHKQCLESLLLESGAVLLRGLPVDTASGFNDVVEAFGYEELPYVGGNAPRRNVVGRVYTSNEAPPDQKIHFHHEMAQAARLGMKLEWLEDGGVKAIIGPMAGIREDKARQRKIWFNSLVAAYTGWKDEQNDPAKAVTFGNGKPLPGDVVHDCLRILEEESMAVPRQNGDVLLIDNLAVLHPRNTYTPPPRRGHGLSWKVILLRLFV